MLKNTLRVAIITAVLCLGTVSARQLWASPNSIGFCRGTCSATVHCSGPCLCEILTGTTGGCVRDPGPVRPRTN